MTWRSVPLVFTALLTACQDQQARRQNAELEKRVAALEAEVKALQAVQVNGPTKTAVSDVTVQAAAQNCAVELARKLELYRQDSLQHRYPQQSELEFPDACTGQKVVWQELKNNVYSFKVQDASGNTLAEQRGP